MTDLEVPTPSAPPRPTAVEWVRSLSADDREAVLMELVRQLVQVYGDGGRINLETDADDYLGYFVPAAAEERGARRRFPGYDDPEWLAELDRRSREDQAIPIQQVIAQLKAEAANLAEPGESQ